MTSSRVRNILTLASGTAGAQLITLLAAPVLSRLYSPSDFGTWAVFIGVTAILVVASQGRYDVAMPLPRAERTARTLFQLALAINWSLSAVLVLAVLAWAALSPGNWSWLFVLVPLSVLVGGYSQALSAWCNRTRSYPAIQRYRLTQSSVMAVAAISLGAAEQGAHGLIWSTLLAQLAGAAVLYAGRPASIPRLALPRRRYAAVLSRRFKDFPLFSVPEALIGAALQHLPVLLLASVLSSEAAGSYAFAYRVVMLPIMVLGGAMGQVFLVDFAALSQEGERRRALASGWTNALIIIVVPSALLFVAGEWLFVLVFGASWSAAGQIAQFLALSLVALFVSACTSGAHVVLRIQGVSLLFGICAFVAKSAILYFFAGSGDLLTAVLWLAIYDIAQSVLINIVAWKTLASSPPHVNPGSTLQRPTSP